MQILKILNPDGVDENNIKNWNHRKAARAIVLDGEDHVGLLHVKNLDYYKLPGGGIESGEDIGKALDRECEEELGVNIDIQREVGSIIEYRESSKLKQTSYCFLAKASSESKPPAFTEEEKSKGFKVIWTKPEDALRLLSLKTTSDQIGKLIEERDLCFLKTALEELGR